MRNELVVLILIIIAAGICFEAGVFTAVSLLLSSLLLLLVVYRIKRLREAIRRLQRSRSKFSWK